MKRWLKHSRVKCDCGHYPRDHCNREGQCDECACIWYWPNIKYIMKKKRRIIVDDLKTIIVFSGCVDKATCGDVVKMTDAIEKLILYREVEARIDEIEHLDYPIRKAELQQQLSTIIVDSLQEKEVYNKTILNELLSFIDGERIACADTKEEQINAQGRNQAYDIVEKRIKEILNEKTN